MRYAASLVTLGFARYYCGVVENLFLSTVLRMKNNAPLKQREALKQVQLQELLPVVPQ